MTSIGQMGEIEVRKGVLVNRTVAFLLTTILGSFLFCIHHNESQFPWQRVNECCKDGQLHFSRGDGQPAPKLTCCNWHKYTQPIIELGKFRGALTG